MNKNSKKMKSMKPGLRTAGLVLALTLAVSPMSAFAAEAGSSASVTRGEFIQSLNTAFAFQAALPVRYKDVTPGSKEADALGKARAAGFVTGFLDGSAKLGDAITREQAAIMIAKAKKLPLQASAADVYNDAASISVWSKGYVGAVTAAGYMAAQSGGSFGPQDRLTAAEAAQLLEKLKKAPMEIISSKAVGEKQVEVTLSGRVDALDAKDLKLVAATGYWYKLDPKLDRELTVKKVTTRVNESNQTVALIEIEESLQADGTIKRLNETQVIPYFTGPYLTGDAAKDKATADSLLTWQLHGGWSKGMEKEFMEGPWDGKGKRSVWYSELDQSELATIDNDATTNELLFLSAMYLQTKDERYKEAVGKAIDLLLTMQTSTGGWPQVYPARGNYSDMITYNDNAMIRVMSVLTMAKQGAYPFNSDIVQSEQKQRIDAALGRGLDYILKSQVKMNGELTAWGAQHDPKSYEPVKARAYEHPSVSGSESVGIIAYLMSLENPSDDVKNAIAGALRYFQEMRIDGMKLDKKDPNGIYIVKDPNKSLWYRFYEIGTNRGIFSGRDGIIKYNLNEIEYERISGYTWAGEWPGKILNIAATTGYFENRVYVQVVGSSSKNAAGQALKQGQLQVVTKK